MRVLVTGANGQLGQSISELGRASPHEILVRGRSKLDVSDHNAVVSAVKANRPDIVINTAAYTNVDAAEDNPEDAFKANELGPEYLARVTAREGIPFIHLSTDYVYDGIKKTPYVETDQVNPLCVYGLSKWRGENAVRHHNSRHLIFRTAWVYSPFGNNFVKTMLRLAKERKEIRVVDDQIGHPTYAPHLAQGLLLACDRISAVASPDALAWGTYHLAGTGCCSWADLAISVFEHSNSLNSPSAKVARITSDQFPTRARRPANARLKLDAIRRDWGITLPEWRAGVTECVERLLNQKAE